MGHTSAGRGVSGMDISSVSRHRRFLEPQGAVPTPGFNPPRVIGLLGLSAGVWGVAF